jgi:hypothetical protein
MKRRKDMRQKYVISRNGAQNELKIREYAIISKDLNKVASSMLQKRNFSLLCEETYESELIVSSISKGMDTLVETLRTTNIFPIEPYVTKIAESVMTLYNSSENGPVELFFNDANLLSVWKFSFMKPDSLKYQKLSLDNWKYVCNKKWHPSNRNNVPEQSTLLDG